MPWAHAEPRSGRDCVLMEVSGGSYKWRTSRCSDEHNVVCQNYGNVTYTLSSEPPSTLQTEARCIGTHIPVIILSMVLLVFLVVFIVLAMCLIYRFKDNTCQVRQKSTSGSKSDKERSAERPDKSSTNLDGKGIEKDGAEESLLEKAGEEQRKQETPSSTEGTSSGKKEIVEVTSRNVDAKDGNSFLDTNQGGDKDT